MRQNLAIVVLLGLLTAECAAITTFLGMNTSRCEHNPATDRPYGKNECRCVGMDNLKGYFATQVKFTHVQYPAEMGASCEAWEQGTHPECKGSVPPQWCTQKWCYVDPCSCNLDVLPKMTEAGTEYQGKPAYYSYDTCGSADLWSQGSEGACVNQKSEASCAKLPKCAWDGKQCGGKEIVEKCKETEKKADPAYGDEDCRCIGLGGRDIGKAFMHINDKDLVSYPPNVGSTCQAWESDTHPDCKKDGDKPSWCSSKWCFVDPCKCKIKVSPKVVMPSNQYMRFQGKTAYWSYATCGSEDTWTSGNKGITYCVSQKSESECSKVDKCAWNGKECLGKALVDICAKQESTGVLGVEDPLQSGAHSSMPLTALLIAVLGVTLLAEFSNTPCLAMVQ